MSEWYDNQKKPSSNLRKLLQERIDKANPRRKLTSEEEKRHSKLEAIARIYFTTADMLILLIMLDQNGKFTKKKIHIKQKFYSRQIPQTNKILATG